MLLFPCKAPRPKLRVPTAGGCLTAPSYPPGCWFETVESEPKLRPLPPNLLAKPDLKLSILLSTPVRLDLKVFPIPPTMF